MMRVNLLMPFARCSSVALSVGGDGGGLRTASRLFVGSHALPLLECRDRRLAIFGLHRGVDRVLRVERLRVARGKTLVHKRLDRRPCESRSGRHALASKRDHDDHRSGASRRANVAQAAVGLQTSSVIAPIVTGYSLTLLGYRGACVFFVGCNLAFWMVERALLSKVYHDVGALHVREKANGKPASAARAALISAQRSRPQNTCKRRPHAQCGAPRANDRRRRRLQTAIRRCATKSPLSRSAAGRSSRRLGASRKC